MSVTTDFRLSSRGARPKGKARQAGVTLMETMIALALSTVVTTAMVVLMGNSMGSATRIIDMTQLSDELRNVMSMMARDVRRANYSVNSIYCYGNPDCATDGSPVSQLIDVQISNDRTCFTYQLERDQDSDTDTDAGGFSLVVENAAGYMKMWKGGGSPTCSDADDPNNADWVAVTDPNVFDITLFQVLDGASFTRTSAGVSGTTTARQREIQLIIQGELQSDASVNRRIEDIIRVRNDYVETEI